MQKWVGVHEQIQSSGSHALVDHHERYGGTGFGGTDFVYGGTGFVRLYTNKRRSRIRASYIDPTSALNQRAVFSGV
jgi:hypothetical protein